MSESIAVKHEDQATLVGFLAIPLWSLTPLLVVLMGPMSAFFLMGFRFLVSGIMLSAVSISRGEGFFSQFRHPAGVWALNILGILISQNIYIFSLQHAPTAEANMINYVWPIYVMIFGALIAGDKLELRHWLGILSGAAGCAVILLSEINLDWRPEYALGYGLALASGLLWAVYQVCMRKYYADQKSSVQGGPFLVYALVCFALFHLTGQTVTPITADIVPVLTIFGFVPISYLFWEYGIKRGHYQFLALSAYFIPLLSAIWIVAATGKQWTMPLLLGGALIVLGPILGRETKEPPNS